MSWPTFWRHGEGGEQRVDRDGRDRRRCRREPGGDRTPAARAQPTTPRTAGDVCERIVSGCWGWSAAPRPTGRGRRRCGPGSRCCSPTRSHLVRGQAPRPAHQSDRVWIAPGRRDADLLIAAGLRLVGAVQSRARLPGAEDRPGLPDADRFRDRPPNLQPLWRVARRGACRARLDSTSLLVDLQDIGARYYTYLGDRGLPDAGRRGARQARSSCSTGPTRSAATWCRAMCAATPGDPDADAGGVSARPDAAWDDAGRAGAPGRRPARPCTRDLTVVPAAGWRRGDGLRRHRTALDPALAQHARSRERLSLSRDLPVRGNEPVGGAGTRRAFQIIGAPWLDARRLLRDSGDRTLDGVPGCDGHAVHTPCTRPMGSTTACRCTACGSGSPTACATTRRCSRSPCSPA